MIPQPNQSTTNLTAIELKQWMDLNGVANKDLAEILGVTIQAVRLWISGQREISKTITKIINLFKKYPKLLREF